MGDWREEAADSCALLCAKLKSVVARIEYSADIVKEGLKLKGAEAVVL